MVIKIGLYESILPRFIFNVNEIIKNCVHSPQNIPSYWSRKTLSLFSSFLTMEYFQLTNRILSVFSSCTRARTLDISWSKQFGRFFEARTKARSSFSSKTCSSFLISEPFIRWHCKRNELLAGCSEQKIKEGNETRIYKRACL